MVSFSKKHRGPDRLVLSPVRQSSCPKNTLTTEKCHPLGYGVHMNSKREDTHQVLESLLTFILNRFKLKACAIIKRTQTYQTALLSMDFWDIIHKQTHAYTKVSVQQPYRIRSNNAF